MYTVEESAISRRSHTGAAPRYSNETAGHTSKHAEPECGEYSDIQIFQATYKLFGCIIFAMFNETAQGMQLQYASKDYV